MTTLTSPAERIAAHLEAAFQVADEQVDSQDGRYRSPAKMSDGPIVLVVDGDPPDQRVRWVLPGVSRDATAPNADAVFELPPPEPVAAERGLVGAAVGRVVKLLLPKAVDAVVAAGAQSLARAWEERTGPEALRLFTPDTSHLPPAAAARVPLPDLGGGHALLLVPDVVGSVRSSFAALAGLPLLRLRSTYDDRILGFEHHSLSKSPRENAEDLARLLGAAGVDSVDVLAHGRGGLVAWELIDREPALVQRVVAAGTPFLGTPLCEPGRIVDFLNRCTDLLGFLPLGGIDDVVATIVSVAGVLATAAAKGLPGLTAMAPSDPRLGELRGRRIGPAEVTAVSSDFRGRRTGVGAAMLARLATAAIGPNDGLVPVESASAATVANATTVSLASEAEVAHGDYFAREEILAPLLGVQTRSGARSASPASPAAGMMLPQFAASRLEVTVIHEGLEYASYPILIGSFANSMLHSTQLVLDDRLGGRLSALHATGSYPGQLGESHFVQNHDGLGYPPGAYIVGLGNEGELDRERLAFTVRQAVLQRCLELFDDPSVGTSAVVGVSSLLLGSAYSTGLSIADSVLATIDGINRANEALEGYRRDIGSERTVRVGALEVVERAADRAEQAVRAVRGAVERLGLPREQFDFSGCTLTSRAGRGALPASLPTDAADEKEVQLSIVSRAPALDGELTVDVTLLGRDARVDARTHTIDVGVVEEITARLQDDPSLARPLFDLLIPEEFEQRMSFSAPIQLIVDEQTANIPWELLSAPVVGNRRGALANVGGIVRRFAEGDSSRLAPRRSTTNTSMVVAAGRVSGEAPLPGVLREAQVVTDIFRNDLEQQVDPLTDEAQELDRVVFMGRLLSENRFVHIASHGTFQDDGNEAAAILGRGLRLTPSLVAKIRAVPEIVFLNCCQLAGIGSRRFAPGMARELMAIGVRAVIAAGWNISDDAAVAFARSFWSALGDGDSLGQAVLEARRAAANVGGGTTWAAYQCYGDPGLRLGRGSRRSSSVAARPTSTDDLVRKLEALAVRATDVRSRQPAEALDKLVAMRGEFRALRQAAREFGHASEPGVQRAVGAAARQLGLFGSAAAAYRAVIERPGAEHGRDLEQLANVEARFAQRKAFGSGLDVDTDIDDQSLLDAEPEALFQLAEDRLRIALGIAKSEERYGLLGSLYKKWATVDRERRDELLRKAFDAYAMAAELPGSRGYGLENARHLAALLGESDPTPSSSATGPVATLPRVLLIDERPTTADYWGLAGAGDRWITELLRSGEPAAGVRDAAVRAYRQAFETRSSASERDSVLTHLRDLARLAPSDSSCKRELAAILVALDDWDPWAQPGPSADATAAEAGPSRSVSRAGDLVVSMFPAGPGDSLVLEWGPPSARVSMLIDGGLSLSDDSKLVRHLTSRHTPPFVDILVVSHVDGDHVKGAIDAVHERGLTYGDVWFNGTNQLVTDRSIAQGCRFDSLTLGENRNPMFGGKAIAVPPQGPLPTVTLAHGATVTFVSPDGQRLDRLASAWRRALDKSRTRGGAGESDELDAFLQELGDDDVAADRGTAEGSPNWGADTSVPNGSSIAFLFEYDGAALLFTGDAYAGVMEQSIARLLVERGVNRLRLDAFKVSHHGSAYNLTPQLLDLVECDRFLISTDGSRHGHPDPPVVELILGKFPEASIIVNHDNPDIRARVGHSTNIVYPDGRSYAVFG